jgi:hypothetical protein
MKFKVRHAIWAVALAIAFTMVGAPKLAAYQSEQGLEHGRGHNKNAQDNNDQNNPNYQQGWRDAQDDRKNNRPHQYRAHSDNDNDRNAYESGYNQGYPQYGNSQYQNGYNNGLPSGDYVQTCRNIRDSGNRLDATCQKRNGGWRTTSLTNVNRCTGGIANNDGRLVCGTGYNNGYSNGYRNNNGYGNGYGSAPGGTYSQTCRNIRTSGNTLYADCETRNGDWRSTSLDNTNQCRNAIANDNGHLVCSK